LLVLQQALLDHGWGPKPLRRFTVQFPKPRAIQAPACEDRVVHHALMGVVVPVVRASVPAGELCLQTRVGGACRQLRNHGDAARGPAAMGTPWVLQGDIAAFLPVRHSILMGRVRRVVRDPDVLWLFETIIRNTAGYNGVGCPWGALPRNGWPTSILTLWTTC
jgi:hypothetical protein